MLIKQVTFKNKLVGLLGHLFVVLACSVVASVAALGQQFDKNEGGVVAEKAVKATEPMSDPYVANKKINPKLGLITLYRPQQGYMPGVASVEINGRYHGALQLGAYSELCLPAGPVSVAVRMTQVGAEIKDSHDATTTFSLQEDQRTYLKLVNLGDGRASLSQVQAEIALTELGGTRRQAHVRSRVLGAMECFDPTTQVAQKKDSLILVADGIFDFGRSEINVANANARQSIDDLINHIKQTYGNQKNVMVSVVGHTDPIGNAEVNKRLSVQRASALRDYLVKGGLVANQVSSEGMGSEQLVVTTCGTEATPKNILCNKPNRRVVVSIHTLER